jgi:hypothetical protein
MLIHCLDDEGDRFDSFTQALAQVHKSKDDALEMAAPRVGTIDSARFEPIRRLRFPAPPPRLHYTTFWKWLTRRIYAKHREAIVQDARQTALGESKHVCQGLSHDNTDFKSQ